MRSITVGLCLFASLGLAQTPAPKRLPVQTLNIESDTAITGTLEHPLAKLYSVPLKRKFDCLIQVRMNFNDKLQESVHEM